MFISTFLKIKNPSIEDNACLGICGLNQEEILSKLVMERCDQMDDKTGNGDKMIEKIEFDGETGNDTSVTQCFQACLRNGECSDFGIRPQKGADKIDCILRRGAPKGKKTWKGAKEYDLECMVGDKKQFCRDRISNTNKLINRENDKYVNSTMEGFQSMISAVGSKGRVKRYAAPVLGGLGMITSGFALFETYQLQQHIDQIQHQFEEFREDVEDFEEASIKFHENILKVYRALETKMNEGFERIECNMRNLAYQMLFSRRLVEWKLFIDIISKDLISGQLVGTVSPKLFNETDVKMILARTELRDTVFNTDIGLFYRLSRTWVTKITKDGDMYNIHMVISIPNIKIHKVYTMYKAQSVGMINGTICTNLRMPKRGKQLKHD
ncbi:hypothetical protein ACHWQZ_G002973 [Mnemiopsis leidyi]